jgi:predicted nucleotidyltransferase component of viral defense system
LYQRRKGRDLFDLFIAKDLSIDYEKVVEIFEKYMSKENRKIYKKIFIENMRLKVESKQFELDLKPLIHPDIEYSIKEAYEYVRNNYISKLK